MAVCEVLRRSKWKWVILIWVAVLAAIGAVWPAASVSTLPDRQISEAAELHMIELLNQGRFGEVYDGADNAFRAAQLRESSIETMRRAFATRGVIVDDHNVVTTCFPRQVRIVRLLRMSGGTDLTVTSVWYVFDDQATLLFLRLSEGPERAVGDMTRFHACTALKQSRAAD
jgi:hypothetical protein